jgi:thiol-disulfide isomerase/thioredoxin
VRLRTIFKGLAINLVSLALLACVAGLLFFRLATHKVAERMRPPHLVRNPEPANDLVYRTLDGRVEHLASTKGKVVYLDLWGTWCIQCVAEMPKVQQLYDHYKDDPSVQFLIISRWDSPSTVRSYARRHHFDLPFYITNDEDIPRSMQLNQFPATFIYDKTGALVAKHVGAADWSDASVVSFLDGLKQN